LGHYGIQSSDTSISGYRVAGKAAKVALVACMRKLLTILNAMMKHRTPWRDAVAQGA
jgi:transposase